MSDDGLSPRQRLDRLDAVLRDTDAAPIDRLHAAWGLHDLFVGLTEQPPANVADKVGDAFEETVARDGLALSPFDAALCLRDAPRTYAFAEGVRRAIAHMRDRRPDRPVRVLYAGTGPFAPLAVLQIPHFDAETVQFTLLDIHPSSDLATRDVFAAMEAEDLVEARHVTDATQWSPPDPRPFDVIVAEVMQASLKNEPQVQLTRALVPLLAPDGVMVPEEIALDLVQVHTHLLVGETPAPLPAPIGRAMTLNVETARDMVTDRDIAPLPSLHVPAELASDAPLAIVTRIRTFDDVALDYGQSGLTQPIIEHAAPIPRAGQRIDLSYRLGTHPKLLVEVAPD